MKPFDRLDAAIQGESQIVFRRAFAAPPALVFECHTRPELVQRWLLGPDGWTMPICEIDLKVGGRFRYVWRHPDKPDLRMSGEFREIEQNARIVHVERFDEDWAKGEAGVTTLFEPQGKGTLMRMTMEFGSKAARDGALASGMASGMETSYARLDAMVAAETGTG